MGRRFLGKQVLFESAYTWLVFVASLDIMFTWAILSHGGYEANALAARIITAHGLPGMIIFKFSMVALVIWLSEYTGRRRYGSGLLLAWSAAILSTVPVVVGLYLLLVHIH